MLSVLHLLIPYHTQSHKVGTSTFIPVLNTKKLGLGKLNDLPVALQSPLEGGQIWGGQTPQPVVLTTVEAALEECNKAVSLPKFNDTEPELTARDTLPLHHDPYLK